jgi:hypothetical protein
MIRQPKWLLVCVALALVFVFASPAFALKIKSVSADQHQMTVTDKDGKDWMYVVTDDAKIFLPNSKEGKLGDLKEGQEVTLIWEKRADKLFTNAILLNEGNLKDALLGAGAVKRVNADQNEFVITDKDNKEITCRFDDKGQVTVGTKAGKLGDLKQGDKVIMVYEKKGDQFNVRSVCVERK